MSQVKPRAWPWWRSSERTLCFSLEVSSSLYFGCPSLNESAPGPSAEQSTRSSLTEALQGHHPPLKVAKPTGCFWCYESSASWGCAWWASHSTHGLLMGPLLEGQSHPGPRSLVGLESELPCLVQAWITTDVTLWFPTSALKYSKLTKATVEFRTNTGGMFSYLFL